MIKVDNCRFNLRTIGVTMAIVAALEVAPNFTATAQSSTPWESYKAAESCPTGTVVRAPREYEDLRSISPQEFRRREGIFLPQEMMRLIAERQPTWLRSIKCSKSDIRRRGTSRKRRQVIAGGSLSRNWSGYVAAQRPYVDIMGRWKEPTVSAPSGQTAKSSVWMGVGTGNSMSDPLVQAGTLQTVIDGKADYKVVYEVVPKEDSAQIIDNFPIKPGDEMYISMGKTPKYAYFAIYNLTDNYSAVLYDSYPEIDDKIDTTAEWIVERPGQSDGSLSMLANYRKLHFYKAGASYLEGVGHEPASPVALGAEPMDMTSCADDKILSEAGPLYVEGEPYAGIDITWRNYGQVDYCQ
ncbi:G1 family glutamic endopeptidase [Actinomadura sp. NPDC000600]|uniref:G1 family glutamic endopeptidase n=1 Tax=Actinomadura sp. NPDC000600 TaxID=3154262 RepID=UPI00339B6635